MIACQASALSVVYRTDPVLRNVDFEVPAGAVMGVVGPNGAGKSTLIKAMLGVVTPLTGHSEFFGQPLDKVRQRVGYMPQFTSVDWDFPTTVRDVVLMGTYGRLGWLRRPGRAERDAAAEAMALTGTSELARRQIGELSGGQRQRVFLARALAQESDLYFMDEPFQGIDATTQRAMMATLEQLRRRGKTVVIVHHDLATVRDFCTHITLLNRTVRACGPVDEAFTTENLRATFRVEHTEPGFLEPPTGHTSAPGGAPWAGSPQT